jgi:hypothetical protein
MRVANALLYAAILGTLLFANRATAQPPPVNFVATPGSAVGGSALAVADLNGDGILDMVAVGGGPDGNAVSIFLGKGDGTFQAGQTYAVEIVARAVVVGDFNGDGHLDLAVADSPHFSPAVTILLGNGDGSFQVAQTYLAFSPSPPGGSTAMSVAAGDFNGDGILDLAVVGTPVQGFKSMGILLGNGDGTFQAAAGYQTSGGKIFIADVNGDGKLDLITVGGNLLLGNGDGTFQDAIPIYPGILAVADLNGDGIPDLVAGASLGVVILLGKGDGSFQTGQSYVVGATPSVVVVDFNGDGHLDLATVIPTANSVTVLLGNGDGTFQVLPVNYIVGLGPEALVAGDFNGDGHPDLAVDTESLLFGWSAAILFPLSPVTSTATVIWIWLSPTWSIRAR